MASTLGEAFVLRGRGTDHIIFDNSRDESYTLNILRGRANRIGEYSGVFATITTPTSPLVASGSITVRTPTVSQINYRLTMSTSSSTRTAERIVDHFTITQGIGDYVGASGKFTITITQKLNDPSATYTILGRVKL
jgi:hypothetical protein